jgi:hypothetical protein
MALTVHIASLCWPTEIMFRKGSKDGAPRVRQSNRRDVDAVVGAMDDAHGVVWW